MRPVDRLPRLLDAVVAISSDLSLPAVLRRVVESACQLVDARYGALGVLSPPDNTAPRRVVEFVPVGIDSKTIRAIGRYPQGNGILGVLIDEAKPLRLHDITEHPQAYGFPKHHPPMRSFLGVPLSVRGEVYGNLYLCNKQHAREFSLDDEELVVALAGAAAVAIDNARLHARVQEFAVLADRERIARDLHDTVIQRLFATGMSLQSAAQTSRRVNMKRSIHQAVDDLDDTIREIRGAIFALHAHERGDNSIRVQILALAAEMSGVLGFEPKVHFDGPVDAALDGDVGAELLATLREALTNVSKHANANAVDIHLRAADTVVLRVVDDGRGLDTKAPRGNGLVNMAARANDLGGTFRIHGGHQRGTVVEWAVPYAEA